MTTRQAVAERAGVSGATVSYVLGGRAEAQRISAATVARVEAVARELGYVPRTAAADLRRGSTGRIALVLGGLDRPFHERAIAAFHAACSTVERELTVSFGTRDLFTLVGQVDGCVLWGDLDLDPATRQRLAASDRALVTVGGSRCGELPHCHLDPAGSVRLAVEHLHERGWKNLIFASGNPSRTEPFQRRCQELGCRARLWPQTAGFADGDAVARTRLAEEDARGCGIIAGNDAAAIGMLPVLAAHGLTVGRDCALVGFDDLPVGAWTQPALTTIAPDYSALARHALARLTGAADWRSKRCPPHLRVRASTGDG